MNRLIEWMACAAGGASAGVGGASLFSMLAADAPTEESLGKQIAALPGNREDAQEICRRLVAMGPAAVALLVRMTGERFGDPKGVKPTYALHALAMWVCRPDAAPERAMFAGELARQLAADLSDDQKAFLASQLQLCGRPEDAAALAPLLASDRLCDPACHALCAIGGDRALAVLRQARGAASGDRRASIDHAIEWLSNSTRP